MAKTRVFHNRVSLARGILMVTRVNPKTALSEEFPCLVSPHNPRYQSARYQIA